MLQVSSNALREDATIKWESLTGFAQNDWKAQYFGFAKAERTQKSG